MTNYIGPFTSVTDEPLDIDADYVAAVTTIPAPVGFWAGVWPLGVYSNPSIIKLDPAVFLGLLTGIGKTFVNFVQADGSPVAIVFGQGPPAGTVVERNDALSVNGLPLVNVYALDLDPWTVEGTVASVTAALTPPPFPPSSGRVILEATIDPAGVILAQQSDLGIALSLTAPHIPGQGYFFTMTGAVPPGYILLCNSPAQRMVFVARPIAPFSPLFLVKLSRPSRTYAAGRCLAGGGTTAALLLASVRTGVGLYDCTVMTTLAPVDFAVTLAVRDADRTAALTYTGPATFSVAIRDLLGAATDSDYSAVVTGIDDGTGSEGFEPLDSFFQIVVVQA